MPKSENHATVDNLLKEIGEMKTLLETLVRESRESGVEGGGQIKELWEQLQQGQGWIKDTLEDLCKRSVQVKEDTQAKIAEHPLAALAAIFGIGYRRYMAGLTMRSTRGFNPALTPRMKAGMNASVSAAVILNKEIPKWTLRFPFNISS